MILINKTKKVKLADNCKQVSSLPDLIFGLLRKSNPQCLLFKTRFGIHTFFLKEPIDVLVLDQEWKVIKIGLLVKPNRVFFWNPKYNLVVELPKNVVLRTQTQIGDSLKLAP